MLYEILSSPSEGDLESEQIKRILLILVRAHSPAPLGYISFHTGIEEPSEMLKKMEERGLIRRSISSHGLRPVWSCSIDPLYEITSSV